MKEKGGHYTGAGKDGSVLSAERDMEARADMEIDHKTAIELITISNVISYLELNGDTKKAKQFEWYRRSIQQSACQEVWRELGRYQADPDFDEQCMVVGMAMARNEYSLLCSGKALPLGML